MILSAIAAALSWAELLDDVKADPALAAAREELLAAAREAAARDIIRRVHRYEDVGQHRTWLDGRSRSLEPEIKTVFALAMSDHGACGTVNDELPLLAAAYRLTGEPGFRDRILRQLEELATWSPLQRPGWSCCAPGSHLPADGKDGAWLATGTGVRAIADTLEILPADVVPPELRAQLDRLLAAEIAQVTEDWRVARPWFVRARNPITNQWVLPTEGLVRACLVLGPDRHREAYELGVRNMLAAFDAHGPRGEFEEGCHYAAFTLTSMLATARAMARAGDRRLVEHPFLRYFPTWLIHHLQPGRRLINAFDCFTCTAPRDDKALRPLLAACAIGTQDAAARWALANLFAGPPPTVVGLACRGLPPVGPEAAPPLFAAYERATRVNWRDSWDDAGSGLWVRGGHATDQHDHQDRGHVSWSWHGRPILIETGTPAYHHPQLGSHFASGMGHNVLQVGEAPPGPDPYTHRPRGWQRPHTVAPLTVRRLDAAGGDVTVDATKCYPEVQCWRRDVAWGADQVAIRDVVELAAGSRDRVLFRWHLGAETPVAIKAAAGEREWHVTWAGTTAITIAADAPVVVTQGLAADHTLIQRLWDDPSPDHQHVCLTVTTREPVAAVTITTTLAPPAAR